MASSSKTALVMKTEDNLFDNLDDCVVNDANEEETKNKQTLDPFGIPLILSKIMLSLSNFDDLKSFRLVCSCWEDFSFDHWRKTAVLQIYPYWKGKSGVSYHIGGDGLNFDELFYTESDTGFKEILPQLQNPFFQQHRIMDKVSFPPQSPHKFEGLYWASFGPQLKYLHLVDAHFGRRRELYGLQLLLIKYCPNLEELILNGYGNIIYLHSPLERLPPDAEQLSKKTSNLKSLTIGSPLSDTGNLRQFKELFSDNRTLTSGLFKIVPNLKNLRLLVDNSSTIVEGLRTTCLGTGKFLQLESILIDGETPLEAGDLRQLSQYFGQAVPPLKILKLHINFSLSKSIVSQMISGVKDTLETLHFQLAWIALGTTTNFDILENLTLLKLVELRLVFHYSHFFGSCYIPVNFRALKGLPNLKCFSYNFTKGKKDVLLSKRFSPWELDGRVCKPLLGDASKELDGSLNLLKLEQFHFNRRFNSQALLLLSKCMPNVSILETVLDKNTLEYCLEIFPKLDKVGLLPYSNILEQDISKIRKLGSCKNIKIEIINEENCNLSFNN